MDRVKSERRNGTMQKYEASGEHHRYGYLLPYILPLPRDLSWPDF
jgi:hypothetical protein